MRIKRWTVNNHIVKLQMKI